MEKLKFSQWGSQEEYSAILENAPVSVSAIVLAGRLLRAPSTSPADSVKIRNNLVSLVQKEQGTLAYKLNALYTELEELSACWDEDNRNAFSHLLSILWLRDDLESLRTALSSVVTQSFEGEAYRFAPTKIVSKDCEEYIDLLLSEGFKWIQHFDEQMGKLYQAHTRTLESRDSSKSKEAKEGLIALQALVHPSAKNSWWLDMIDPHYLAA